MGVAPQRFEMSEVVRSEDALSRAEHRRQPLYVGRVRVYAKRVAGTIRRVKWAVLVLLLAIYYLAPWLRWDRGPGAPDQALLIDLPNRRAYFLWIEIWPQEIYYLAGLLILGALGLFLATSVGGRVWCGFACPQTVWTDLFMWVERLIEGDRAARINLDRAPPSRAKLVKKAAKHAAWLVIALLTGGAWIMYFRDAPTVVAEIFLFSPDPIEVPAGRPVTFRLTSPDVLHGFQVVGTNSNALAVPGYVSQFTVTFPRPGEYQVLCNEYCGILHHNMTGKLVVTGEGAR